MWDATGLTLGSSSVVLIQMRRCVTVFMCVDAPVQSIVATFYFPLQLSLLVWADFWSIVYFFESTNQLFHLSRQKTKKRVAEWPTGVWYRFIRLVYIQTTNIAAQHCEVLLNWASDGQQESFAPTGPAVNGNLLVVVIWRRGGRRGSGPFSEHPSAVSS